MHRIRNSTACFLIALLTSSLSVACSSEAEPPAAEAAETTEASKADQLRKRGVELADETAQVIAETTDTGSAERTAVALKALGLEMKKVQTGLAELGETLEADPAMAEAWNQSSQRIVEALSSLTALDGDAARIVTSALAATPFAQ